MAPTLSPEARLVTSRAAGRRERPADNAAVSFARNALLVLEALALEVVVAENGGGERLVAAVGSRRDLAQLRRQGGWTATSQGADPGLDAAALVTIETGEAGELRLSRPLCAATPASGTLRILCPPGWSPDTRTHSMVAVLAGILASMVRPDGSLRNDLTPTDRILIASSQLSELAMTANSYAEMVGGVTAAICTLIGAAKAGVALWIERGSYLQMLDGSFGVRSEFTASSQVTRSDPNSQAARVVATHRSWFANRALDTELPGFDAYLLKYGVTKIMELPLVLRGEVIGVAHVANREIDFDRGDVEVLEKLTPFVAATLKHVQGRLELKRKSALAQVVREAATSIAAGQPLAGLYCSLTEFCKAIGARMLAVSFGDDSEPIVVSAFDRKPPMAKQFLANSERGGDAVRTAGKRPRAAGDIGWDALHVPVVLGGQRKATLSVLRVPSEPFSASERAYVARLAEVIALAWATEHYQQERAQMARLRERQRIADDLHDHVAQLMFSAQMALETVLRDLVGELPVRASVERAVELLSRGEVGIREAISRLDSPKPASLVDQLAAVVQSVEEDFAVPIHLETDGVDESISGISRVAQHVAMGATREALVNSAKHAGLCRIGVTLSVVAGRRVRISVIDDGVGRRAGSRGHGLQSHRSRVRDHGGLIRVTAAAQGGTRVLISFPLDDESDQAPN